jgi:hypothetical protein
LQPQWLEIIIAELAGQVALQLVSVLGSALAHKLAVKVGVLVHGPRL